MVKGAIHTKETRQGREKNVIEMPSSGSEAEVSDYDSGGSISDEDDHHHDYSRPQPSSSTITAPRKRAMTVEEEAEEQKENELVQATKIATTNHWREILKECQMLALSEYSQGSSGSISNDDRRRRRRSRRRSTPYDTSQPLLMENLDAHVILLDTK